MQIETLSDWYAALERAGRTGDAPRLQVLSELLPALVEALIEADGEALYAEMLQGMVRGAARGLTLLSAVEFGFAMPAETAGLKLDTRRVVASRLGSAAWRRVPYAMREQAFFAARVEHGGVLSRMQGRIRSALDGTGPTMDSGRFLRDTRRDLERCGVRTMPAAGRATNSVRDIRSQARLKLIFETQVRQAEEYAKHKASMDPDLLDAAPGWRFARVHAVQEARPTAYWSARWVEAWSAVGGKGALRDPMVALKTSPIWQALGGAGPFDNAWPPYAYGSGMGRVDADRDEVERLGLLAPDEEIAPEDVPDMNETLEARDLDARTMDDLEQAFGDQVTLRGNRAHWRVATDTYRTAADLGLAAARAWERATPPLKMTAADGMEVIRGGVTVSDVTGQPVRIGEALLEHWRAKSGQGADRTAFLPHAIDTLRAPSERWIQDTQDVYLKVFQAGQQRRSMMVAVLTKDRVDGPGKAGDVWTYFPARAEGGTLSIEKARKGLGYVAYPPGGE